MESSLEKSWESSPCPPAQGPQIPVEMRVPAEPTASLPPPAPPAQQIPVLQETSLGDKEPRCSFWARAESKERKLPHQENGDKVENHFDEPRSSASCIEMSGTGQGEAAASVAPWEHGVVCLAKNKSSQASWEIPRTQRHSAPTPCITRLSPRSAPIIRQHIKELEQDLRSAAYVPGGLWHRKMAGL